jgi:hypothetical protein
MRGRQRGAYGFRRIKLFVGAIVITQQQHRGERHGATQRKHHLYRNGHGQYRLPQPGYGDCEGTQRPACCAGVGNRAFYALRLFDSDLQH